MFYAQIYNVIILRGGEKNNSVFHSLYIKYKYFGKNWSKNEINGKR